MCVLLVASMQLSASPPEQPGDGRAVNSNVKHQGRVIIVIYSVMPRGRSRPAG